MEDDSVAYPVELTGVKRAGCGGSVDDGLADCNVGEHLFAQMTRLSGE